MARISERLRVSRRIAAITESATLAVDAKAKALRRRRRGCHRLRRGGARLPDARHTSSNAAVAACQRPEEPPLHARGRSPRAACGDRGEDRARLRLRVRRRAQVLVTNGGKQAVYNAFQALLDPGDEVLLPAPYWTTYPESIALAEGVPVCCPPPRRRTSRSPSSSSRRRAPSGRRRCCSCSPSNPTGAVYPPERGRGDRPLGGRARHLGGHRRDLRAPHLRRRTGSRRCPSWSPELADTCVVVNGVAKTYAMTGWRVGWMIGPRDVIAAATNLQSHSTSNVANVSQRAARSRLGDLDAVARCVRRSSARQDDARCCRRSPASVHGAAGRVLLLPVLRGRARTRDRGRARRLARLCELLLEEVKVAIVPGEAFGAPGTHGSRSRSATTTSRGVSVSPRCSGDGTPASRRRVAVVAVAVPLATAAGAADPPSARALAPTRTCRRSHDQVRRGAAHAQARRSHWDVGAPASGRSSRCRAARLAASRVQAGRAAPRDDSDRSPTRGRRSTPRVGTVYVLDGRRLLRAGPRRHRCRRRRHARDQAVELAGRPSDCDARHRALERRASGHATTTLDSVSQRVLVTERSRPAASTRSAPPGFDGRRAHRARRPTSCSTPCVARRRSSSAPRRR